MARTINHPLDLLPLDLLTAILQRLPHFSEHNTASKWSSPVIAKELSRVRAGLVGRRWREASRACEWEVALLLPTKRPQRRLDAFVAWAAARHLISVDLRSAHSSYGYFQPVGALLSLAGLQRLAPLTSLAVSLCMPHDLLGVGSCARLRHLCVDIPQLSGHVYTAQGEGLLDGSEDERDRYRNFFTRPRPVQEASSYTLSLLTAHNLGLGVACLQHLRELDVCGAVAGLGTVKVDGADLVYASTLPWLSELTSLSALTVHARSAQKRGVWALPSLRSLDVRGAAEWEEMSEKCCLHLELLQATGRHLTAVAIQGCSLRGAARTLSPSLKTLHLQDCKLPGLQGAASVLSRQVKLTLHFTGQYGDEEEQEWYDSDGSQWDSEEGSEEKAAFRRVATCNSSLECRVTPRAAPGQGSLASTSLQQACQQRLLCRAQSRGCAHSGGLSGGRRL